MDNPGWGLNLIGKSTGKMLSGLICRNLKHDWARNPGNISVKEFVTNVTYTCNHTDKAGYSFEPAENILVPDDKTAHVDCKLTDASGPGPRGPVGPSDSA